MTREQAKANLEYIKAFAEGKTIQVKRYGNWEDGTDFSFHLSPDLLPHQARTI
jgi:hypothetical protein